MNIFAVFWLLRLRGVISFLPHPILRQSLRSTDLSQLGLYPSGFYEKGSSSSLMFVVSSISSQG